MAMRRRQGIFSLVLCHLLVVLLLAGCGGDARMSGTNPASSDAGSDAVTDGGADAEDSGPDAEDAGPDADVDPGCTDGSQCESGVCDTATGECQEPTCDDGVQNGDETDADCGGPDCGVCDDGGACAEGSDCASGVCDASTGVCAAAACDDTVQNGDETDVDCGGSSCGACADGATCATGGDCASGVCDDATSTCTAAACDDGLQNGDETATDCGGSCDACANGSGCATDDDCQSQVCDTDTCVAPACTDGVQNGDETDTDCGGPECASCTDGSSCAESSDCTSGVCDPNSNTCAAPACDDEVQNGDESDVDCGGSCDPCADGGACTQPDDCASGVCPSNTNACAAPACDDGVQNGDETDADCGGSCDPCADGGACAQDDDCTSGVCDSNSNTCAAPACDDGIQNGNETDTDCGGPDCSACADGDACAQGSDCTSGVCDSGSNTCAVAACDDGVQNGNETDTDCGGPDCSACADGATCAQDADCTSGVCDSNTNTCAAPACDDNVQNGDESDVDCGGSNCGACGNGQSCRNSSDCTSGYCGSGVCFMPASCKEIADQGLASGDGTYTIDTDGPSGPTAPFDVHCDMTSDGGVGYTMVRFDDSSLTGDQDDYRALCASYGMEIIVPRTRDHAESIKAWNGDEAPNLVNVFPETNGATGLSNWQGRCQGQSCSFFMDESNGAGCTNFEPNGDNNTSYSLFRRSSGCLFGNWNDANNRVTIQGWAICSTNDADPPIYPSCTDYRFTDTVHNASPDGTSGVYTLDADGPGGADEFDAHCDMVTGGGGWTMAIKANGANSTFHYDQSIWTSNALLTETASALDHTEAKLATFNEVPLTQVLVGLETPVGSGSMSLSDLNMTPLVAEASSLYDLLSPDNYVATNIGRTAWKQTVGGSSLQPNCNQEGFNVRPGNASTTSRARIGIVANQENDCASPDSRIGVGTGGTTCGTADDSVGNNAGCSADNGDVDIPGFGVVWVRDVPVLDSCLALLNAGYDRDGVYAIDPDGQGGQAPQSVYCDMTTEGGGWTLVTVNGTDGRPALWSSNAYPRPGASNYGAIAGAARDVLAISFGAGLAANYSFDAAELYANSGREFLAYVGGATRDYITGTLPQGCNYFDGTTMCEENVGSFFTVYNSDGTTLTTAAQACTTANAASPWDTDPYTEFGLHLLDGSETDSRHCHSTSSALGHQDIGRIYTTFESDPSNNPQYWTRGVHSHWNESGSREVAGFLMIR